MGEQEDDLYRQRFKQFVLDVYALIGNPQGQSLTDFVDRHFERLSVSGFRNWLRGDNASYDIRQLSVLAKLRGWTIAQAIAYLYDSQDNNGGGGGLGEYEALVYLKRTKSRSSVYRLLQKALEKLQHLDAHATGLAASARSQNMVNANWQEISRLCNAEMQRRSMTVDAFAAYLELPVATVERLLLGRSIPRDDDAPVIKIASYVQDTTGNYGSEDFWLALFGFEPEDLAHTDCESTNGAASH